MTDTTHHVNESADKIRLKTKLTRGTDTRDQETIEVVVKGDDPDEAVDQLDATLAKLASTAVKVRGIQPGGGED